MPPPGSPLPGVAVGGQGGWGPSRRAGRCEVPTQQVLDVPAPAPPHLCCQLKHLLCSQLRERVLLDKNLLSRGRHEVRGVFSHEFRLPGGE